MNDYIGNIYKKEEQEIQPRISLLILVAAILVVHVQEIFAR